MSFFRARWICLTTLPAQICILAVSDSDQFKIFGQQYLCRTPDTGEIEASWKGPKRVARWVKFICDELGWITRRWLPSNDGRSCRSSAGIGLTGALSLIPPPGLGCPGIPLIPIDASTTYTTLCSEALDEAASGIRSCDVPADRLAGDAASCGIAGDRLLTSIYAIRPKSDAGTDKRP